MTKFSVITIFRNNVGELKTTLESIINQNFQDFELILVDGFSEDGSYELAMTYQHHFKQLIRRSPAGIYDALNCGLEQSEGEFIVFVHGGDKFKSTRVLEKIADYEIRFPNCEIFYGGKEYLHIDQKTVMRRWLPGSHANWKWLVGWMPPHLGCVVRRRVYKTYGSFDVSFKISGDYEFLLRTFYCAGVSAQNLGSEVIIQMGNGGVSHNSLQGVICSNLEVLKAWWINCRWIPIWIFVLKPLSKISQFFLWRLVK